VGSGAVSLLVTNINGKAASLQGFSSEDTETA